ncbi:MAG: hypothetical protein KME46_27970 [Brasilonema angustatum HA4187-MV1]|jgi:hypothetical protein|nr:hypothetical protein [Brasilonema angustatum HA4187-MV1]
MASAHLLKFIKISGDRRKTGAPHYRVRRALQHRFLPWLKLKVSTKAQGERCNRHPPDNLARHMADS